MLAFFCFGDTHLRVGGFVCMLNSMRTMLKAGGTHLRVFIEVAHRLRLWAAIFGLALSGAQAVAVETTFLEPEQAFSLTAPQVKAGAVSLKFTVAPGYYLYREHFAFVATGATLGAPVLPRGEVKFDSTFNKEVETYRNSLEVTLPFNAAADDWTLSVSYQGCAEAGLCYPPQTQTFKINRASTGMNESARPLAADPHEHFKGDRVAPDSVRERPSLATPPKGTSYSSGMPVAAQEVPALNSVQELLQNGQWWAIGGTFVLMGVMLAFTPCVLPMLPILSSIIVGAGGGTRWRSFGLALCYSLGMALVYTALGVAAGLAGEGLSAALQQPSVVLTFAALLVLLSLAMFDVYDLRLPSALTNRVDTASRRLRGGQFLGVFVMGSLSALIVSPCVSAPLAGTLVFLSQSRDVFLAGGALFCLAAGMSVPLLILGLSAGQWLPRSGPWMHAIKRSFGLLLLGVAAWLAQPALPAPMPLIVWAALLLVVGFMLRPFDPNPHSAAPRVWVQRAAGVAALAYGVMQLAGAASGGSDALQPLRHLAAGAAGGQVAQGLQFRRIRTEEELDEILKSADRPVMLDFYADWCVACKEMERFTLADQEIQRRLAAAMVLQVDVTANNPNDRALLKRYKLFGPPGILFFAPRQSEPVVRVIGYQDTEDFKKSLQGAGL